MGKRRCAFENETFDTKEFKRLSGFLIHVDPKTGAPVDPPHEAIEGRRLTPANGGFAPVVSVRLRAAAARRLP